MAPFVQLSTCHCSHNQVTLDPADPWNGGLVVRQVDATETNEISVLLSLILPEGVEPWLASWLDSTLSFALRGWDRKLLLSGMSMSQAITPTRRVSHTRTSALSRCTTEHTIHHLDEKPPSLCGWESRLSRAPTPQPLCCSKPPAMPPSSIEGVLDDPDVVREGHELIEVASEQRELTMFRIPGQFPWRALRAVVL